MDKFCVFCGKKPQTKTREHVLPQWLLQLTGDPTRIGRFSSIPVDEPAKERFFSFNSFAFPACESCNNAFSALEDTVKPIVCGILDGADISAGGFSTVLDWFDKVRVGLWLAFMYLDKNPAGVKPHFHMAQRIGVHDRMLVIYRTDNRSKLLNFAGCDTLSFRLAPSCFLLRVNAYVFINLSYPFLIARRIGFPFPIETYVTPDEQFACDMAQGRHRVMMPLLKMNLTPAGTELYQPMFGHAYQTSKKKQPWESDYVKQNSLSWEKGVGKVFIPAGKELKEYPDSQTDLWVPQITYQRDVLQREANILTLELQNLIMSIGPSSDLLSKQERAISKRNKVLSRRLNNAIIEAIRKK